MTVAFTAWEEVWFAEGDDDETRARRSAKDWESLIGILGSHLAEPDEWDEVIARVKATIGPRKRAPTPRPLPQPVRPPVVARPLAPALASAPPPPVVELRLKLLRVANGRR